MPVPTPNDLRVEMTRIGDLHANPNNARTHNRKSRRAILASIRRFGFLVPIIVDRQNMIVAGNGRYLACVEGGIDEVPVIRADLLTPEDYRAFALAENRVAELSGWDENILAAELNALFESGYEIEVTGFTTADLDFSLPDAKSEKLEQVLLPDLAAKAVSRRGDLWRIGPHRLYCGDSRLAESYETLLEGELAAMVFADAPYGVRIAGNVSGLGKVVHREFEMMSGEQTPAELTAFLRACFRNCVRFSQPASIHYQCMDWRHMREMLDAADGVYSELKNVAVWVKPSAGMGTFYRSRHEFIFIFKSGKGKHKNNFGLGDTGRSRSNVWEYQGASGFHKGRKRDLEDHPTIKNTALVADAILDCSDRNDLILDPFSGSATTLLAAHKTGRRGAAIEIDPLYVDTSLRRLADATGLTPVHANGRTFDEVAADREAEEMANV
jgi:DNA modification methylase